MTVQLTDTQFKEYLEVVQKHTPSSTTLDAPTLQGPFHTRTPNYWGIFSDPGVRPERFSALAYANTLGNLLAANMAPSEYVQEILEIMTGVTQASGTNATGWCGDPPTVGEGKTCQQIYSWGDYLVKTHLNALPRMGKLRNRADVPGSILNTPPGNWPLIPDIMFNMLSDTRSQLRYELFLIGVQLMRVLDVVAIQGNNTLASTATNHGWIAEFDGLDRQVKTGYTDAKTGTTCEAVDSVVVSFSAAVGATSTPAGTRNMTQVLADTMFGLRRRAEKMQFSGGVQWAIVMREELFRALTEAIVCQYFLYACAGSQYEENNIDQRATNELRLAMQNGNFLMIDGREYPVVFTEGIAQTTPAANTMQSDIFILPISWMGVPLTRLEFAAMNNQYINEWVGFVDPDKVTSINNGLFLVGEERTGLCSEYHFAAQMRIILETPMLAARIDDINYTFQAPIRNAIPGQSFYDDGGVSKRLDY
jgi:hypothetical protein